MKDPIQVVHLLQVILFVRQKDTIFAVQEEIVVIQLHVKLAKHLDMAFGVIGDFMVDLATAVVGGVGIKYSAYFDVQYEEIN